MTSEVDAIARLLREEGGVPEAEVLPYAHRLTGEGMTAAVLAEQYAASWASAERMLANPGWVKAQLEAAVKACPSSTLLSPEEFRQRFLAEAEGRVHPMSEQRDRDDEQPQVETEVETPGGTTVKEQPAGEQPSEGGEQERGEGHT